MEESNLRITMVGGPTAVLHTSGLRLLTDPTFDPPGGEYVSGAVTLRKTSGPALSPEAIGPIDAVLLSHDQHFDNLDHAGRAMLDRVGRVFTTPSGSERLGVRAVGLKPWQFSTLVAPDGRILRVTATPARHGPPGIEPMSGEVTGFLLTFDDSPDNAAYFSGDTVWFEGVAEVAKRYHVRTIVLSMGAARVKARGSDALTMTTEDAIKTARAFPSANIVPVHFEGWAHFSEGRDHILKAFASAGLSDRLHLLWPGRSIVEETFAAGLA